MGRRRGSGGADAAVSQLRLQAVGFWDVVRTPWLDCQRLVQQTFGTRAARRGATRTFRLLIDFLSMRLHDDPVTSPGEADVDPALTGGMAVAKAVGNANLLSRLIGPLADEIGINWAEGYRRRNAAQVARKAAQRLGGQLDQAASVHARVAYRVLQDGSFVNDDVMQEYLAGLLAGSRTQAGDDDRAAYYVDLVARLPSSQVRLHHAVYAALASSGASDDYGEGTYLQLRTIFTPVTSVADVLGHPSDVDPADAVGEALTGLSREGLLSTYAVAEKSRFLSQPYGADAPGDLVMAGPSVVGCTLALWSHAIRDANLSRLPETANCNFDSPGPTFNDWRFMHGPGPITGLTKPLI